jgi:uncharacterized membrane protein
MKLIANIFLKGFLFTLPLMITFGLIYWLFDTAEAILKQPLMLVLPEGTYVTGLGVLSALVLIFFMGILVQAYVLGRVLSWFERQIERIPLVKTLYVSAKDLLHFMAGHQNQELQKVVAVEFEGGIRLLGFVTNEQVQLGSGEDLLAVYLPMSYQVGGYTAYLPRSRCDFLTISPQQAMQQILTAHIQRPQA